MLTIVSPCILPVLPFVFAKAVRPFLRSGLPLLAGMAATFAVVATLAAVGGWAVAANQYGRLGRSHCLPCSALPCSCRAVRPADPAAGGARFEPVRLGRGGRTKRWRYGTGRGDVPGLALLAGGKVSMDHTFEIRVLDPGMLAYAFNVG